MNLHIYLVLLTLIISGCQPLQQAPLAYSSKQAWGVDISSTSTETPGISMVVGYKSVDAAYVPVAVSKKCPSSKNCEDKTYELKMISGAADETGSASAQELEQKRKASEDARKALEGADIQIKLYSDEIDSYNKDINNISDIKTEDTQTKKNEISTKIATSNTNLQNAKNALPGLKENLEKATKELNSAEKTYNKFIKQDAFSVYGRFESKADAEAAKLGVAIGKIFSTGVASQNLTSGLSNYYRTLGESKKACYHAVQAAAKASKPEDGNMASLQAMFNDCKTMQ